MTELVADNHWGFLIAIQEDILLSRWRLFELNRRGLKIDLLLHTLPDASPNSRIFNPTLGS
jgi:hypothetical protein